MSNAWLSYLAMAEAVENAGKATSWQSRRMPASAFLRQRSDPDCGPCCGTKKISIVFGNNTESLPSLAGAVRSNLAVLKVNGSTEPSL
jgi:hypothetical protein